jgi:GNAT superfamily N-acetyltransferase
LNVEERSLIWRERIAVGGSLIFVAECDTGIVGFACGGKLREAIAGYDAELYAVYLLRENQRCGAGRALVRTLVDSLRDESLTGMVVWVLEKNPAVSFYRKLGGVKIAQKSIEIGGMPLEEVALGWPDLDTIALAR